MKQNYKIPTPEENARMIFARREDALRLLDEARQAGKRKDVARCEAFVRSFDKMIAQYGLDRYATRT